jgi:hypothetical protein
VQYDNDTNNVQFGVTGQFVQNVIKSRSLGVESVTGKGDWNFNFSPFVNYNFSRGGSNAHLFYSTSVNEVSGDKIEAVHMLPGYTHNIINLSETENLVTVMWANEQFDPNHPDTFAEKV